MGFLKFSVFVIGYLFVASAAEVKDFASKFEDVFTKKLECAADFRLVGNHGLEDFGRSYEDKEVTHKLFFEIDPRFSFKIKADLVEVATGKIMNSYEMIRNRGYDYLCRGNRSFDSYKSKVANKVNTVAVIESACRSNRDSRTIRESVLRINDFHFDDFSSMSGYIAVDQDGTDVSVTGEFVSFYNCKAVK